MECDIKYLNKNAQISKIIRELRRIFNECDKHCLGEVDIQSLVNKASILLQGEDDQQQIKEDLYQRFSCCGETTTINKDKFDQCVISLIDEVFGKNDEIIDEQYASALHQNQITTSTPKKERVFDENFFEIRDNFVLDDGQNIIPDSANNSQMRLKEELSILRREKSTLEKLVNSQKQIIASQLQGYEKSPCKKCEAKQISIDELRRSLKENTEIISTQYEELAEEMKVCKENENKSKKQIIEYQKNEKFLQNKVEELQSSLQVYETLNEQNRKDGEIKSSELKRQRDQIVELKFVKSELEDRAYIYSQEIATLKNENNSLREYINSERCSKKIVAEEDETDMHYASEKSLFHELNKESKENPRYGYSDISTQTVPEVSPHDLMKVEVSEVAIQSSKPLLDQETQTENDSTLNTGLEDDACFKQTVFITNEAIQKEIQVITCEEMVENDVNDNFQINNRQWKNNYKYRKILLFCCLLFVLILLFILGLCNYSSKLVVINVDLWKKCANLFKVQFKYLRTPPK